MRRFRYIGGFFGLALFTCVGASTFPKITLAAEETSDAPAPATVEQVKKVLDLTAFPLIDGSKKASMRSLGMLMYEAKLNPKEAFETQRKELTGRGFKELPGAYLDNNTCMSHFAKDGFVVAVSASLAMGDIPDVPSGSSVSLVNRGNVDLNKLPTPDGVKPFYPSPTEASYTTTTPIPDTAAACRKLLLAAGWEPYGQAGQANQQDSSMQYFKRNAIKLLSWVTKTPAEGGKTLIRYSTELMSADLPAPADASDPRYDDYNKKLDMDEPAEKTDSILAFYRERLPKMGWKATTDKPITDAKERSQFLIFRNDQKDLLSLDLTQFDKIVRVKLAYQTAAEVEEEDRRAKTLAQKRMLEEKERKRKVPLQVSIPANAREVVKKGDHRLDFSVSTGAGPATFEALRTQFKRLGWTEVGKVEMGKTRGELNFKKDKYTIRCSYFDIGVGDADISLSSPANIVFEPVLSGAKTSPTVKKGKGRSIPGLPKLPAGVELPEEAKKLLDKAQDDIDRATKPEE